jgi:hypothetical protein
LIFRAGLIDLSKDLLMHYTTAYYVAAGALVLGAALAGLAVVAVRRRMRPASLAIVGSLLVVAAIAAVPYGKSGEEQSASTPRFHEQAGQSTAGKNDSTNGKDEGGRAREIQHTAGPLQLSNQQQEQLRDSLARQNSVAMDTVDVSLTIGAAVPRQIALYVLPTDMSDILHGYNGDKYLVVRDQLVIVDSQARRIVALIPAVR